MSAGDHGMNSDYATITHTVCTACGSLIGKNEEDWEHHQNWHRLVRNLTTAEPPSDPPSDPLTERRAIGLLLAGRAYIFGKRAELTWPDGLPDGINEEGLRSIGEEWSR